MGANVSTTENNVTEEVVNKTINSYMQNSSNEVKNTIGSNQVNQLVIGDGAEIGCEIELANTAEISAIIKGTMDTSSITNLQNELKSDLSSEFSKKAEQTAGLSFGAANVDTTINNINMEVNNLIENKVTQESVQTLMNTIYTVQNNVMTVGKNMRCLPGAKITMNNKSIISAFASAMTKSIMDGATENTTLNEVSSKFEEEVKQTTSIFAGLGGLIFAVVLIGALTHFRPANCFKDCKGTNASMMNSCMATCKKSSFLKGASSRRTKMILGFILLILLIVLGFFIARYIKAMNKKSPTTEGDSCFPPPTELKKGAKTYKFNKEGVCTVVDSCNEILGYEVNSTSDGCELKPEWNEPMPDGSECVIEANDTTMFCTSTDRENASDDAKMKNNNICESNQMTACTENDCKKNFCGAEGDCEQLCVK
jgi:hypothetical protein